MRTLIIGTAVVVTLALLGARALGQEAIATPNPVAEAQAGGVDAGDPAQPPVAKGPDSWRYRWQDGRWWYWTPAKRWMWYGDGQWVYFEPTPAPYTVHQPGYVYPGYYAPYYRPGVAVGVGPYGNVGVGVGRRVGVDVWGGHGGVRVGRIGVGW